MVQKVSSLKAEGLSPSDCDDHSEEKEISDDDDDDRNHKHRRREAQSQSMERDVVDQVFIKPNRKRNKPFENGNPFRGNDSQSSEPWKTSEPWKRRPIYARGSNMANQPFLGDLGQGRGRGKELNPWIHHDPRFSSVIGSQMVPPGPNMFAGRGLGSSWSAYGLIPGVLNGGMDPLPPLGLQGPFRPSISPPPNMGIIRQRCRDFEERGFCLRGDMCPMEHGINRIVVEDVQSLSQFNLPVSLPSGNPLGFSSAALPSSSMVMNSNSLHGKSGKPERTDGGTSNGISTADGSDFYDPDQPLWASDCPGTSTTLQGLNPSKFDETEFSDTVIAHIDKTNATAVGSQGTSTVWGRVGSKNKSEIKGRFFDSTSNKAKQGPGMLPDFNTSSKTQDATQYNIRKPTQKALRTLFVNCIPKKENNVEALLSHFKKFGEIIDIYIPHTGDRAFVQFSKREEAERALKAPDAVMGNRFIKLSWANRDRITEDVPTPRAVTAHQAPPYTQKGKDGLKPAALELKFPNTSISITPRGDNTKPVGPNTTKATPPSPKKPGNLALLEEFRKRQESFAQKRDALQRELAKMEKKAAGSKGEASTEKVAKRQKVETVVDSANADAPNSSDSATKIASPKEGKNSVEIIVNQSPSKPVTTVESHERTSLKQSIRPLAPPGAPFGLNRFKLDNRPTAFKISPPLPPGLENLDVLKEHFSAYGEISSVEIEDGCSSDSSSPNNYSALISFTNRRSAEKAFINGKLFQDQTLEFTWTTASNNNSINEDEKNQKKMSVSEASNTVSAESGNLGNKNSENLRSSSSSASGNL